MSTISIQRPQLFTEFGSPRVKRQRNVASWNMAMNCRASSLSTNYKTELCVQIAEPTKPQVVVVEKTKQQQLSDGGGLRFDRVLQPSDQELAEIDRLEFGKYVARNALIDEELWTAAWLRAESHWEDQPNVRTTYSCYLITGYCRYADNFKRKFSEQEFAALKRRCSGQQNGQKSTCIVTVRKKEPNVKHTVLKGVVGTLDLSIRQLLVGETYPGERVKAPLFCSINRNGDSKYGYVSNLCVSKSARRQGIAVNMLQFAIQSAKLDGVEHLYVHVHRHNKGAQALYEKMGFEIVESATPQLSEENTYLLCLKM
ncbi:hypothetical protein ACFE04_013347 [Oxalis oulophora]